MSLREGDRVLVPDREHAYLPATVVQRTEAGLDVRLVDGSTHTLAAEPASQVVLADPLALQGSDDMVRFNLLTEASIVHNLRVRYEREAIYTAVGPILISVNPLRQLEGLFGPEVAQRYADAADEWHEDRRGAGRLQQMARCPGRQLAHLRPDPVGWLRHRHAGSTWR